MERRHRGLKSGGNLRAAVFGVNDGLVSNASLIFGVAGATSDSKMILLSGVAGLLAGAFSMAAGEYVSVRSQREMYEYQIGLERDELGQYPEEEASELAMIYVARGIPEEEAKRMANVILVDPSRALDTLAREELGLNPDELGSPWGAARFSFFSFAAGALLPLLPFLWSAGARSLALSVGLTAASLFARRRGAFTVHRTRGDARRTAHAHDRRRCRTADVPHWKTSRGEFGVKSKDDILPGFIRGLHG